MLKKGLGTPQNAPKPENTFLKKTTIQPHFAVNHLQVWVHFGVSQALFSTFFGKFGNFRRIFIPLPLSSDKNSLIYDKVKPSKNDHIFAKGGPRRSFVDQFWVRTIILPWYIYIYIYIYESPGPAGPTSLQNIHYRSFSRLTRKNKSQTMISERIFLNYLFHYAKNEK